MDGRILKSQSSTAAAAAVHRGTETAVQPLPHSVRFFAPCTVLISWDGLFAYVSDTLNHCIRRVEISSATKRCGMTITIAGNRLQESIDGEAMCGAIQQPTAMGWDRSVAYLMHDLAPTLIIASATTERVRSGQRSTERVVIRKLIAPICASDWLYYRLRRWAGGGLMQLPTALWSIVSEYLAQFGQLSTLAVNLGSAQGAYAAAMTDLHPTNLVTTPSGHIFLTGIPTFPYHQFEQPRTIIFTRSGEVVGEPPHVSYQRCAYTSLAVCDRDQCIYAVNTRSQIVRWSLPDEYFVRPLMKADKPLTMK